MIEGKSTGSPRVSVVLPSHRGDARFELAVQSCLEQTLDDFELILVLHRAEITAANIAHSTAASDSRVVVLESNGSFVDAVNMGHRAARGQYVARMDSDDWAHPDRLKLQAEMLDADSSLAVASCFVKVTADDGGEPEAGFAAYERWLNSTITPESIAAQRFIESPVANPTAMFRREILESLGGYRDTEWAEDYDLFLRLLDGEHRIAKIPEMLLEWRDHAGRLTRTDPRYSHGKFLKAKAHFVSLLPSVKEAGIAICGAGPIGKQMARFLQDEGIEVHAFFEVHPRRIGESIHGIPVRDQGTLAYGTAILLGAVGIRGKRDEVRGLAMAAGYTEGLDFFSVA